MGAVLTAPVEGFSIGAGNLFTVSAASIPAWLVLAVVVVVVAGGYVIVKTCAKHYKMA